MEQEVFNPKIQDKVRLEDKYDFSVLLTLNDKVNGGYLIVLEFLDLGYEEFKNAVALSQLNKPLKIRSELFLTKHLSIDKIVVANFRTDINQKLHWECIAH